TPLRSSGISWRAYVEDISGSNCPTASSGLYAAYHNPFVYFTDLISNAPNCLAHLRPYGELAVDLASNTVARYNFIIPNLCHDSHNSTGCATADRIKNGDLWMAAELPRILHSPAWSNNGALFITWDERSEEHTSELQSRVDLAVPYTTLFRSELAVDLASNTVARYNFIIPNLCHDSHNSTGCATADRIKNGDLWMAAELPRILHSPAWSNNGALFITWDE